MTKFLLSSVSVIYRWGTGMKLTKKHSAVLVFTVLLWLGAVACATVFDLDISRAVANENSVYGRILEVAGEPPAILFASFNLAIMAAYFIRSERNAKNLALSVSTVFLSAGTAFYCYRGVAGYLGDYKIADIGILAVIVAGILTAAIFLAVTLKMKRETVEKYFITACRTVLAALLTLIIIWAFKLTWGRVRPRQLDGDLSRFTRWYLPQGFTGYFSFPSGHTANATVIFSLTYYLEFLPERYKKAKGFIYAALVLWIALVAFSRVCVGAHYLSDVLFGMAITFAIVYFARPRKTK